MTPTVFLVVGILIVFALRTGKLARLVAALKAATR